VVGEGEWTEQSEGEGSEWKEGGQFWMNLCVVIESKQFEGRDTLHKGGP